MVELFLIVAEAVAVAEAADDMFRSVLEKRVYQKCRQVGQFPTASANLIIAHIKLIRYPT